MYILAPALWGACKRNLALKNGCKKITSPLEVVLWCALGGGYQSSLTINLYRTTQQYYPPPRTALHLGNLSCLRFYWVPLSVSLFVFLTCDSPKKVLNFACMISHVISPWSRNRWSLVGLAVLNKNKNKNFFQGRLVKNKFTFSGGQFTGS